jgi:Kae1-associated kinase Bud32
MNRIAQGAEAIIYKDGNDVIKERLSKSYRLKHLDDSLRQFRTRREAKVLSRLEEFNFPAPHMKEFSDKLMSIVMDFIPGETLKDVLKRGDEYQQFAKDMGAMIGRMHTKNIIHGDLTTSNMIVHMKTNKLHFIDFGLAQFSERDEDKAVDLFLFERSLASTHFKLPTLFEDAMQEYKISNPQATEVLKRLEKVRMRGRNKGK